jgi:quercetin dioxygenase-like cupin family protein
MHPVLDTGALDWMPFPASSVKGFELKAGIVAREYTDAYSVDLIRIAPNGCSDTHTDRGKHAFFLLRGKARIRIGDEDFEAVTGAVVKFPVGVPHSVHNTGTAELVFLAIYDPPRYR